MARNFQRSATPHIKHADFVPSLSYASREAAFGVMEGGANKSVQFWAMRLDRSLDGSRHLAAETLEAAVEFATKDAKDGDRFQIMRVCIEDGTAEMIRFHEAAGFHFGVSGPVGFQYRDDGDWFTRAYANACFERDANATCPWSGEPVATVAEISTHTRTRRTSGHPAAYGHAEAGTGRCGSAGR